VAEVREIRTIAVIGAGRAGRIIAQLAAIGGFRTILEDILPASLRRAEGEIRGSLEHGVNAGVVAEAESVAAMARLEFATCLENAAREADMVIEAVPDEFESKEEIFRLLDRICRPGTLLVSSSISLRVTDIAAVTERPADIVGMRFHDANTGDGSAIDVIAGEHTAEETSTSAMAVTRRMAAKSVLISEAAAVE
jgi:3-hydroxybutyryl-CoA dehydrogenase